MNSSYDTASSIVLFVFFGILAICLLVVWVGLVKSAELTESMRVDTSERFEYSLRTINSERAAQGLPPLNLSSLLEKNVGGGNSETR